MGLAGEVGKTSSESSEGSPGAFVTVSAVVTVLAGLE